MKIQECMTLFCEDAERSGYSVTEEAKQKLSGLLETRNEMQLDNETLVLQLIRQIQLDKLMQPETENRSVRRISEQYPDYRKKRCREKRLDFVQKSDEEEQVYVERWPCLYRIKNGI